MSQPDNFYAEDSRPKSSNRGCWIAAIVVGVLAVGGIGMFACCGGLGYFALEATGDQVAANLQGNPVVVRELGGITDISFSITGAAEAAQQAPGREGLMAFDATGPKGKGLLVVETRPGGQGVIVTAGTLKTADGVEHDLFPEAAAAPPAPATDRGPLNDPAAELQDEAANDTE